MGKLQRKIQKYSVPTMWAAGVLTLLGLVFSKLSGWEVPATAAYLLAMVLAGGADVVPDGAVPAPGPWLSVRPLPTWRVSAGGPRKGCF